MTDVPKPTPTELSKGFWDAARRHELVAQRCTDCRHWRHYPQLRCPHCHSPAWNWEQLSGRGHIHSYSVAHRAFHPAWADRVPYVVATIELDEGIRMVTDMDAAEMPNINDPVVVWFERLDDETVLPKFKLAR